MDDLQKIIDTPEDQIESLLTKSDKKDYGGLIDKVKVLHKKQKRSIPGGGKCGYYVHPLKVALLLREFYRQEFTDKKLQKSFGDLAMKAGLFHDTLEDCDITEDQLYDIIKDSDAIEMIKHVTNPETNDREKKNEILKKQFSDAPAFAKALKLCDIICNIRSMENRPNRVESWKKEKLDVLPSLYSSFGNEASALYDKASEMLTKKALERTPTDNFDM